MNKWAILGIGAIFTVSYLFSLRMTAKRSPKLAEKIRITMLCISPAVSTIMLYGGFI